MKRAHLIGLIAAGAGVGVLLYARRARAAPAASRREWLQDIDDGVLAVIEPAGADGKALPGIYVRCQNDAREVLPDSACAAVRSIFGDQITVPITALIRMTTGRLL